MSSGRFAEVRTPIILSILMVLMTQVGYLDLMNAWSGDEETLDETNDVLETGGSGSSQSNFTSSIEGADLIIDEPMTNITFQYNTNAASGSGSGSGSCSGSGSGSVSSDGTYNGNNTKWMVKDINTVVGNSNSPYSSNPSKFVVVGNTLYFSAYDGIHGEELWKTDGTAACTVMVKDINSGYGSSNPGITEEAVIGNTLYFGADDGTNGYELWKTDGTASGTVMVKNINSGSGNSGNSGPAYFTVIGNTLYFRAGDASGYELWKSDGTTSGTVMVKDINSGGSSSPNSLTAIGNTLYFQADDGTHGRELWKSDGTASGTVMVKDIYASPHGVAHSSPSELTSFGNALYFRAYDPTNGTELWKSDGTTSGTVCLKDIISGSSGGGASEFTVVGDTLFFLAYTVANRYTIWKTNGTTSGTVMVKDTCSGCSSVYDTAPHHFTAVGDTLFFVGARSQYQRVGVWVSDGTTSGTTMLKSFTSSSNWNQIVGFTPHGDTAYFKHLSSSGTIYSMWQSDGTASGTVNAGLSAFTGTTIAPMGTTVYVSHHDNQYKTELWALDPAAITGLSTGIANVTGATCTVSPSLPTGLSIDSSTCTISGTPTVETTNTTYTVTANISNVTYQTTVWLSSAYLELTPSVEGADLITDEAMTNITFQYNASAASGSGSGSSSSSSFAYANDKVSTGTFHACAILDNGDLKCWGGNYFGSLGDGANTDTNAPSSTAIDLGTGRTAVAVSAGAYHTCAILDNGDLKCWGHNGNGQLGDGSNTNTNAPSSTAIDLGTGRTAVAVSAGDWHTCAILDNDDLKCWGANLPGQLGDGTNTDTNAPSSTSIDLGTGRTAVAVSSGNQHTCAILDNGDLKCWGLDDYGQLGDGGSTNTNTSAPSSTAIDLGSGRTAVAVSAGHSTTCVILDNGDIKCWGRDNAGQLGDGGSNIDTNAPSSTAIDLGSGRTAVALSVATSFTCAILDNGEAKCWGQDAQGQLGDGGSNTDTNAPSSTAILGSGRTAVAVSGANHHACAILDNGDLKCWGYDYKGQLGDGGSNTNQGSPVLVSGSNTWDSSTEFSTGSSGGMTDVTGATCTVSPSLPTGLSIDSGTCTISGTPTVETSNTTYTITAVISGTTYQTSIWLSTSPYGTITSAVEGAHLNLGEAMTPITLNYTSQAPPGSFHSGNGSYWMVKDIRPQTSTSVPINQRSSMSSQNYALVSMGDFAYFAAYNGTVDGLWKSDGTESGTVLVKEHLTPSWMVSDGNSLYFHNGSRQLWMSDGTTSGTVLIKEFNQTNTSGGSILTNSLGVFANGLLFFVADDDNGRELWSTDGTTSGTQMVKDIRPGYPSSQTYNPYDGLSSQYLIVLGNHVYFGANDGTNGSELWKSDGTESGTVMVNDINSGSGDGFQSACATCMAVLDNNIYFSAYTAANGVELWKSDGTASGTLMVKDINTGTQSSTLSSQMVATEEKILFKANDGIHGEELWESDGTAAGTALLSEFTPTAAGSSISHMTSMGESAFFHVYVNGGGISYRAAFVSDGTPEGTFAVVNSSSLGYIHSMTRFTALGDQMYFVVNAPNANLYVSDGTTNGTTAITPFTGSVSMYNGNYISQTPVIAGNTVLFASCTGVHPTLGTIGNHCHEGVELMAYDPVNITLNSPPSVSWETEPPLPAGMSISGGTISGTPSVYALNQTYTIYANQSGYSTTHELYFSVNTTNAHTVVEHQAIDAIGFHPPFNNGTTAWTVSPALPGNLSINGSTGEITGTVNATLANTTFTVTASHAYGPAANMSGSVTHPSGNSGSARGGSLAIDSNGFVHVAYCYSPDGGLFSAHKLGYMTDASGSWVATEIDSVCRESVIPQIVLNSNNSAHISYTKPGNTQPVMYATNVNGTWETSTLVSDLDASTVELSIFVDSNDAVHMAYCKYSGAVGSMYHITDASGAWVSTTIASMGGQSGCPSHDLVVDSNDNVYVAYHKTVSQGSDGLFIATNASGSWSVPSQSITNTTANGDGANPELTIDSNDNLHLIYSKSGSRSGVYYATCSVGCTTSGNWAQTTISTETVNHLSTSIDVDSNDKIHIAYMGTYNAVYAKFGTSYLATNANGTWVTTELHEEGYGVDLAIDLDHTYHLLLGWRPNAAYLSIGSTPVQTSSNYSASGFGSQTFTFNLQSLADYDGDGLPNDLPSDYNAADQPTPGLVADSDDDGDGLDDSVETGTGNYVDGTDTGTNPLNPDTDGDGICDGPNAVAGVCVAGPDADPNGETFPPTLVALNNTAISTLSPYKSVSAGTYEIAPDLPASLSLNPTTGEITGTPTETTANTTYTMWSNNSNGDSLSWDFTIEILEDSDGDGLPNELPGDYDPTNPDSPGLTEDLDDDADGVPDTNETDAGTSPTNPDTDGDGMCDGPNAVGGVCTAGPDAFPLDPSADTDTDGDGQPDSIDGNSTSVPPLTEDEDDDGDGLDDVNETNTGINNGPTDTGTDPLDPDTDNDGICDGPNAVYDAQGTLICVAGPDATPFGEPAEGGVYGLNNTQFSSLVPPYQLPGAAWSVSPDLPEGLSIDSVSGIISGTPTEVIDNTTYTITGITDTSSITFDFNLQILEDTDRDGLPNELPEDYPGDGELVEDLDDDGDGASDLSETGTGIYNGTGDLGTDSLNPDTDGDGICDGPNAVPPVCMAGPDSNPVGTGPLGPSVLVNNTEATPINPPNAVPGATWEVSPDLPDGLVFDPATGIITGTPTQAMDNTTFTIWANTTDPAFSIEATFWLEILEDFDGDGMPDQLPDDYPDTGVEPYTLVEDEDDDNDGMSDTNESIIGTDPRNPDTDGDGFCDGPGTGDGACYAGPDSSPLDPTLPVNTDGDAYPDIDPDGPGGLTADDDDDNDGYLDTTEVTCESEPLNATSIPDDMDGDGICDLMDDDMDGDGIPNDDELGLPVDTSQSNPDSDGDGTCDGPEAPANGGCVAGPDAFPLDPAGALDTDNDGKPNHLVQGVESTSQPPLVEDLDDDDDTWSDADELACGTSSTVDASSFPADTDGDGICDALDPYLDLPFTLEYPTQYVDLFVNRTMEPLMPFVNGSGEVITWELEGELPEGLTFGWSPARDAALDGSIRGTPVNTSATVNLTVWANNSVYTQSFPLSLSVFNDSDNDSLPDQLPEGYVGNLTEDTDDDNDGLSDSQESECGSDPNDNQSGEALWKSVCLDLNSGDDDDDDGINWMWCFPCLLLLLLVFAVLLLLGRDQLLVMLSDGPEPENTFAEPDFTAGSGTEDDPFILAPVGPLQPGATESTVEEITITNMGDISVEMIDYNDENNYGRFNMYESAFSMEGSRRLSVGKDGEMVINFKFNDSEFPTYEGGTYTARIKLGKASVYFLWDVTVMADEHKAETAKKSTMDRIKKRKKSFDFERIGKATKKNADDLQAIKGIGPYSEEKLNALGIFTYEQLANFDRKTEDDVNDAIEHYKGRIRRDEWVKQAQDIIGAQAKADEEALKAAEEAQAKAEAEAKAEEEAAAAAAAAAKAEADAKKAEEKAAKDAQKAEEKAAKDAQKAEEKAAKDAQKAEEKAAKDAQKAEEKAAKDAEKKAKTEADKKAKEEAAAAAAAKKAEEEAAAAAAATAAAEKEAKEAEKKAKADAAAAAAAKKAEEKAAKDAKKAEEKAAKEAKAAEEKAAKEAAAAAKKKAKPASKEVKKKQELKRVQERAKTIDFKVLGTAKASEKDDLQVIKGIGPFIEEKLNALGIYTYLQVSKMTSKLETDVNEAIEFFPGRVKRDQWVNQAKILLGEDVKLDEKALKQAEELERIAKKAEKIDFATLGVASASEKDDLKSIKGIGPFIEEKLNALGIFTFEQVSKMTAKIEEEVNVAIEFFPGRVKRDEWAKQAKQLHKENQ